MCGILGLISSTESDLRNFESALSLMQHRGPDYRKAQRYFVGTQEVLLGHNRLSIIDLSEASNQPMEKDDYVICFNGEIYNYKLIQERLINDGVKLLSDGDTEVILNCYIKYGIKYTLSLLEGMYSFAILDKRQSQIILARDRVGIKPLYYLRNTQDFIFSSEIKSITSLCQKKPTIDPDSEAQFYFHRFVQEPRTIYKEIDAVDAGEYLQIDINTFQIEKTRYWSVSRNSNVSCELDAINKIDYLLNESVKKHLVSDVPISFALSGGLDSSLLIAIAKQYRKDLTGFTIKRDKSDIDWLYSTRVAEYLNVSHVVTEFKDLQVKDEDKKIFEIYDQPIGCSSIFSTYLLYKRVSKDFKVCISGDGADEIFGGYNWYKRFLYLKAPHKLRAEGYSDLKQKIKDLLKYYKYNDFSRYKKIVLDRFDRSSIQRLIKEDFTVTETQLYEQFLKEIKSLQDLLYLDFNTFLRFSLTRTDLSSMAHSVETRVPFLDHKLVEYAFTIDPKLIMRNGQLKYLLKKVAERYLPKDIIYRPKKGFSAPIQNILPVSSGNDSMLYVLNKWKKCHN